MAIIRFITAPNTACKRMKIAINYIKDPLKTEAHLVGAKDCSPDTAYYEFIMTKQNFNKEKRKQYIHFVQSFSPNDKATPELINYIGKRLLLYDTFKNFQVIYSTHTDKVHLHNHFIINSVCFTSGQRWYQSKDQLQSLKEYSNELCKEYGLIVVYGVKGNCIKDGEYRSKIIGQSWKYELYLAVNYCKWCSQSKEDFINNMTKLEYRVDCTDERKYITFTTPDGKKCRNTRLHPPQKFTKEVLFKAFELTKQGADKKQLPLKMKSLLTAIQMLSKDDYKNSNSHYPLTTLEGQARKERAIEEAKGRGLDWDRGKGEEI